MWYGCISSPPFSRFRPLVIGAASDSPDGEQLAARGREFARAGRLEEAEAAYRAALKLAPNHFAIMYNLGALSLQRGDPTGALAWFLSCRDSMPSSAHAHLGVGQALLATGRAPEAAESLRQAIAQDSLCADAHNALGLALMAAGDVAGAEAGFRAALSARPNYAAAISNLCDLLGHDGRAEQAARELEGMREAMPDNPNILFKLGYVKAFLGDLDAAAMLTRRVTELLPNYPDAYLNLGTFAQWRHDVNGALVNFRRALTLSPQNRIAEGNLAHALLYAGDYAHGWAQYETRPMGVRSTLAVHARPGWGPRWTGADLSTGTLLLHGEGGFGDVLQFCRYAAAAHERAGRVVIGLARKYASLA
ncbi:MAG: tetratricopeptide repeat protein, partial [Betaproteobacteria bacterium]